MRPAHERGGRLRPIPHRRRLPSSPMSGNFISRTRSRRLIRPGLAAWVDVSDDRRFVLTLSCPDRTGIGARITAAAYHSDEESGRFFTRQEIRAASVAFPVGELRRRFGAVAGELA